MLNKQQPRFIMSQNHNDLLTAENIANIARLAKLSFDESQCAEYSQSLNKILGLMQDLQKFDTENVEPLKSPFDTAQPLRDDAVTEQNKREQYQAVAPATQAGLYLVPRVIE